MWGSRLTHRVLGCCINTDHSPPYLGVRDDIRAQVVVADGSRHGQHTHHALGAAVVDNAAACSYDTVLLRCMGDEVATRSSSIRPGRGGIAK